MEDYNDKNIEKELQTIGGEISIFKEQKIKGLDLDEQRNHYKNSINRVYEYERDNKEIIIDQVRQMLNYRRNHNLGTDPMYTLFEGYALVLKEELKEEVNAGKMTQKEFNKIKDSLDNSLDCICNTENYLEKINELTIDEKSFIVAPVWTRLHVFSAVIYKINANTYEVAIVNKGGRENSENGIVHDQFEIYEIPDKKIDKVVSMLKFEDSENRKVETVYNTIFKNSNRVSRPRNLVARDQRVGNCYYSEIIEGLKYMCFRTLRRFKTQQYVEGGVEKNVVIPKLDMDKTQRDEEVTNKNEEKRFKDKVLNKIIENHNDKDTINTIIELKNIYDTNKGYRDITKNEELSIKDKKEKIYEVFGDKNDLKKCFEKVDERTLQDNIDVFISILRDNKIEIPNIMFYAQNEPFSLDFIKNMEKYFFKEIGNYQNDIRFIMDYFPTIYKNYSERFDNTNFYFEYSKSVKNEKILNLVNNMSRVVTKEEQFDALMKVKMHILNIMNNSLSEDNILQNDDNYIYTVDEKYLDEQVEIKRNKINELIENNEKEKALDECKKLLLELELRDKKDDIYTQLEDIEKNLKLDNILNLRGKNEIEKALQEINIEIRNIDDYYDNAYYISLQEQKIQCYKELGKSNEALELCREIIEEVEPLLEDKYYMYVYLKLNMLEANINKELGNKDMAIENYEKIMPYVDASTKFSELIVNKRKIQDDFCTLTREKVQDIEKGRDKKQLQEEKEKVIIDSITMDDYVLEVLTNSDIYAKDYITELANKYIKEDETRRQEIIDSFFMGMNLEELKQRLGYNEEGLVEYKIRKIFKNEHYSQKYIERIAPNSMNFFAANIWVNMLKSESIDDKNANLRKFIGYSDEQNIIERIGEILKNEDYQKGYIEEQTKKLINKKNIDGVYEILSNKPTVELLKKELELKDKMNEMYRNLDLVIDNAQKNKEVSKNILNKKEKEQENNKGDILDIQKEDKTIKSEIERKNKGEGEFIYGKDK